MSNNTDQKDQLTCPKSGRIISQPSRRKWVWMIPVIGFISLVWYLIRVIPKPERAAYPCQRVAAPLARNFLAGSIISIAILTVYSKIKTRLKTRPWAFALLATVIISLAITVNMSFGSTNTLAKESSQIELEESMPNAPVGVGRGIFPGRVVWAYNPEATSWDGVNGVSYSENNTSQQEVDKMLSDTIRRLSGKITDRESLDSIFKYFNKSHSLLSTGYQKGEKIAIKINMNNSTSQNYNGKGNITNPQLLYSLLKQLVVNGGVQPSDITVFDASRAIPDVIFNKCSSGILKGINFADFYGGNGRIKTNTDKKSQINWSFDVKGNPTFLPDYVTSAKYFINLASLKGHNLAGVTLCAKNNFGTICNSGNDGKPSQNPPQAANIHGYVAAADYSWGPDWTWSKRPMGTYNVLVDLMGNKDLGEKTLLYILDALYVARHQSVDIDLESKWEMQPFKKDWVSSIFASLDGVAIDSVGYDFLNSEPSINKSGDVLPKGNTATNYLREAALANDPPSGTIYAPNGDNKRLKSLGVHEHWNNPIDKKYSRNLGKSEGIELVQLSEKLYSLNLQKVKIISCTNFGNIAFKQADGKVMTMKLSGVKAPKDSKVLKQANTFIKALLLNKIVFLEKGISKSKNNTISGYIWFSDLKKIRSSELKVKLLNAMLLNKGFADYDPLDPNIKYKEDFEIMQSRFKP